MRKLLKIFLVFSIVIGFIIIKYSNFNGYCEEEGRVLTKEELIKKAVGKIYEENPYCCVIVKEPTFPDNNNFINKLFGRYFYQVNAYYKRDLPLTSDVNEPYYEKYFIINQCGKTIDVYGLYISEKEYVSKIQTIKQLKQEK